MVGLYAEPLPKGFGFSDTAFRVFILMASRRLKSDRFFTDDYDAGTYTQAGLVRRIEPAGHPARFETRAGDNHHHVVCRSCGRTEDVDCVRGSRPCLEPESTAGFRIHEAALAFRGPGPARPHRS